MKVPLLPVLHPLLAPLPTLRSRCHKVVVIKRTSTDFYIQDANNNTLTILSVPYIAGEVGKEPKLAQIRDTLPGTCWYDNNASDRW